VHHQKCDIALGRDGIPPRRFSNQFKLRRWQLTDRARTRVLVCADAGNGNGRIRHDNRHRDRDRSSGLRVERDDDRVVDIDRHWCQWKWQWHSDICRAGQHGDRISHRPDHGGRARSQSDAARTCTYRVSIHVVACECRVVERRGAWKLCGHGAGRLRVDRDQVQPTGSSFFLEVRGQGTVPFRTPSPRTAIRSNGRPQLRLRTKPSRCGRPATSASVNTRSRR
jgi:hypothetical protein